ncbi:vitelline envelope sperm lysin receptor-like isoform X1 [Mytilus edulis]|uniref:vitelline envelope sperm lysin receptor-like isoform X1 n=1 Tax=Mytilus edulis TaxID=6550 RepID=UPI0039EED16A
MRPFSTLMCVLFVFFIRSQIESLPQGIVVDFDIECGENINDTANITFLTDVDYITPVALCNGTEVILTPIDDFRSTINASYPGGPDVGCIFLRTYGPGIDVYSVNIEVAHNVNGTLIQNADDVYSLTCSFGDEIDGHADARKIDDSHFPPKALTDIKSRNITTNLTLDVVDYGGVSLTGKLIPLGKNIRLKGEISATSNETSFRAFSCQAISYDGIETFNILIGGCGDGLIFKKNNGFTTTGSVTFSPFFKAFRMRGNPYIKFQCQFTACQQGGGCNGSTCYKDKR